MEATDCIDDDVPCFIERNGGIVLLHDGRQYYKKTVYKNLTELWRCANYTKMKCKGTITLKNGKIIKKKFHFDECNRNIEENETAKIIHEELKLSVKESDLPVTKIYEEKVSELMEKSPKKAKNLPAFRSIQHCLYSARNKYIGVKKIESRILSEIEIPNKFHDFLLADYTYENTRILVFCSENSKKIIGNLSEFFVDGTFASCPDPFTQLFSIHGEINSSSDTINVVPLIYALLMDKKQKTYEILFELIKSQLPNWNPIKIHCDYEIATINALTKIFPYVNIKGCYYHWVRNIWKKGKFLKHTKSKPERRILSLFAVLPLLPEEKIEPGLQYIINECENIEMAAYLKYIERVFKIKQIKQIMSVFGERHRTTNVVEAWHSKINRGINKNTVNILRLLNVLKNNDYVFQHKFDMKRGKTRFRSRSKKDIVNDDFIKNVQLQHINGEITLEHMLDKLR